MNKHELAKEFRERPLNFIFSAAIFAAVVLGPVYFVYYGVTNKHRNREDFQMGVRCTSWVHESRTEKDIDGPDVRDMCARYFAARSAEDARMDDAVWLAKLQAARAKWARQK